MSQSNAMASADETRSDALHTSLAYDFWKLPSSGKSSEVLADAIRSRILSGELAEGAALPVERQLAISTGTSRTAVREALRLLEAQGLISTKPGRGGGSFVRRPDVGTMENSLSVFIAGRELPFQALVEVREVLEPLAAALAARHRTESDLEKLESLHHEYEASIDDIARFVALSTEWHISVAKLGRNELLHAIILSLSNAIHHGTVTEDFASKRVRESALNAHREIMKSIRSQDPDRARRRMANHLIAYSAEVQSFTALPELQAATRKAKLRGQRANAAVLDEDH